MQPMGWSPVHRDLSLGASVEQGPPSHVPDTPLCQQEHWEEVPRVSLYSWQPCVNPYSAHQNQNYHILLLVPHKLSSEWISSFLSCCCASRLDLPAGLIPFSICHCFCTTNANRRTSPAFFPSLSPFYHCPVPLTCLALACSAEITTFNSDCGLG